MASLLGLQNFPHLQKAYGYWLGVLRMLRPYFHGALVSVRRRRGDGEIEAFAPFDSRIRFQHIVVKGRDQFLFHQDHDALDQFSGALVFRQRQIDVWIDAIRARKAWCAANGAVMRQLFIPEKHLVYREHLPRYIKISQKRPVLQLLDAAQDDLAHEVLYPLDELIAATAERQTFLRTDTHWTSFGAFTAYRALCKSLEAERPLEMLDVSQLGWKSRAFTGDLGVRFHRERSETMEIAESPTPYHVTFQNHNYGRGAVHIYESDRPDLPRCVLFRDSFSNAMIPFLMHGFSRLVAVSSLSCHYDLLEQEKPDIVLFAVIERFVATFGTSQTIELPQDDSGIPFAEFSGTPLSDIAPPPPPVNGLAQDEKSE